MLYIPTSVTGGFGSRILGFESKSVRRGQLYHLTENEKINFQFNPETFEWQESQEWVSTGTGIHGRDVQYMGEGDVVFDLPLTFIADPGAPSLESEGLSEMVSYEGIQANFDGIVWTLQRWTRKDVITGRPGHIRVLYWRHVWDGVIRQVRYRIIEKFESGNTRHGELVISFKQWSPIK